MKRFWHIGICSLLILLLAAALTLGILTGLGLRFSSGYCVITDSGACMIVLEGTPVELTRHGGSFRNLSTGDRLLVLHGGIQETFPAQTAAYLFLRTGSGSIQNIPQSVIDGLTELGWLTE